MDFDISNEPETLADDLENEDILAALGVEINASNEDDITNLKNVRPRAEVRTAEEIGRHTPCKEFDIFKPLFVKVQQEIKSGIRTTRPYKDDATVGEGYFYSFRTIALHSRTR